jgi:hypothetical protein
VEPIDMTVRVSSGSRRLGGRKKAELMSFTQEHLSPAQLKDAVSVRSYKLTIAGRKLLDAHPEVVAKHQKNG